MTEQHAAPIRSGRPAEPSERNRDRGVCSAEPVCCHAQPACCHPEPVCCHPEPVCCHPEPVCCHPEPVEGRRHARPPAEFRPSRAGGRIARSLAVAFVASIVACGAVSSALAAVSAKESPVPSSTTATLDTLDFLELEIVYTTVVARYYEKINPRTLVDGARNGIAAYLGEVGLDDARLPFTPVRVSAGDGEDLVDTLVLKQLARYGKRLDGHRLVQATVAGELASLRDPYSLLFRPQAFKKFNAFLGNETFGGIGAVVSLDDAHSYASIDRLLPGGPAERGGLMRGDRIIAIDGRPVRVLGDASGLRDALRGKIGTSVRIDYERSLGFAPDVTGHMDPAVRDLDVTLVRAAVHDPEVTTARFGDTGYLALSRFGDRAGVELTSALRDFKADGVRAIVLDLRANGGGYGDEATAVASAFVTGPVFTTRERGGATTVAAASGKPVWTGPLAVLVDGDTASAAEIVAGAIQDDGAGTLVGTRTFGKGVVQSVFPLPDGSAVKLTTARYTTPNGRDIDKVGIAPDTVVAEPPGSTIGDPEKDAQLARALEVVRSAAVTPPSSSGIPSRCSHAQLGGSRAGPCYNRGL